MSSCETRELMRRFDIRPTKSLGQNFLTDDRVIGKIMDAAGLGKNDTVIEIGPGLGTMTEPLAQRAGCVLAVEIDRHLIPALEHRLLGYDNVRIVNEDILKLDIRKLLFDNKDMLKDSSGKVKVVSNLPYYITTPIIMKLLEEDPGISAMLFMVQKEVAKRLSAAPGGKDYGSLSVAVQYYSKPELVMTVPQHCFIPQPDVESAIVRLEVFEKPAVIVKDKNAFFKVVRASFGQRRKTLANALHNSGYFTASKDEITQELKYMGLDENIRGEALTIMQFAQLTNSFQDKHLLKIY